MKNKIIITVLSLSALPFLASAGSVMASDTNIANFEDCANHGYPIMQTFPETCRTSDGRMFTRNSSAGQNREVMDGIGRSKDRLQEEKNRLYGSTSPGGISGTAINPEILKAMREGKRGEELLKVIIEEMSKLKDRTLSLAKDVGSNQEKLKKTLVSKITDPKRIEIALIISGNFNNLNRKVTDKYLEVLNKLETILNLNEISAKADLLEKSGKNISDIKTALTNERELIQISRLAVKTQALKIYSINVGSDANLKKDFGAVRQTLQTDLEKVRETVRTAHSVLKNVLSLMPEPNKEERSDKASTGNATSPESINSSISKVRYVIPENEGGHIYKTGKNATPQGPEKGTESGVGM